MTDSNNQKVIFLGDTAPIISEILKKYGLEESPEDIFKKIHDGGSPCFLGGIILDITMDVINGKISEKDLVSVLQKDLMIPKQKAEGLAKDIKEKLIAIAKKVLREEAEKIRNIPEEPEIKPEELIFAGKPPVPIGLEKFQSTKEEPSVIIKPPATKKTLPMDKQKKHTEEIKKTPKEPDVYREPIE